MVVFVRHALPGERVVATVTEVRRGHLRADAVEVLVASADRVTPPCPYAAPGACGGCDLQHAAGSAQRQWKAAVVREQLGRLGGLSDAELAGLDVRVAELPGGLLGWRTRVRYTVDADGRAGLLAHRSHRVVPVDRCRIAHPRLQELDVTTRRWRRATTVTVATGAAGDVVVQADGVPVMGPDGFVSGPSNGSGDCRRRCFGRCIPRPPTPWPLRYWTCSSLDRVSGPGTSTEELGCSRRPWPAEVCPSPWSSPRHRRWRRLASTFPRSGRCTAPVEVALRARASGRSSKGNRRRPLLAGGADLVVLDPPRAGAGAAVVRGVTAAKPRAVAYVACDPAAFARDVRTFREAGWSLAALRGYDCFPMTQHVELVGLLVPRA